LAHLGGCFLWPDDTMHVLGDLLVQLSSNR
jgi:hypothetical protein